MIWMMIFFRQITDSVIIYTGTILTFILAWFPFSLSGSVSVVSIVVGILTAAFTIQQMRKMSYNETIANQQKEIERLRKEAERIKRVNEKMKRPNSQPDDRRKP